MGSVNNYLVLRRIFGGMAFAWSLALIGCAGTVKHQGPVPTGAEQKVQGLSKLSLALSPKAQADLESNKGFNQEELTRRIQDRLQAKGLVTQGVNQYVDVVVNDVRVRSAFTAIMFGFMAGDDHIKGRVRLMTESQQELRAFDVSASYAFGGFAGGQDGTRMKWLYDKFSDLVLQELEKLVAPAGGMASRPMTPSRTPNSATSSQQMSPSQGPSAAVTSPSSADASAAGATGTVASTMIVLPPATPADKVLENPTVAHRYHLYLSRPKPKAFAVSDSGAWWMAWGESLNPTVKETVPQRALRGCQERSQTPCVLYAVDDQVVYGQGAEGKR